MPPFVMPLTYEDISTWLKGLTASYVPTPFPPNWTWNEGPYVPEEPDELITLTMVPGTGYVMEGAGDAPAFQVRIRSQQNYQHSARDQANMLDWLIVSQIFPQKLNSGNNLLLVSRVGGAPDTLGPPDDAYRFDYVGNYYAIVGVAA